MSVYRVSGWKAYAIAAGFVGIAALCRSGLEFITSGAFYYALFFPAIGAATFFGGYRVGVFALVLTNLVVWAAFIPPKFSLGWPTITDWTNIAQFSISGGLLIWLAEQYGRSLWALAAAEERRQLVTEELIHRSRNSLAVASTVISRTLANQPEIAKQLIARLNVLLGAAHVPTDPINAKDRLSRVLKMGLEPYGTDRFTLIGDDVEIAPRQARDLALVIHELATNSAKYGAFSVPNGFLTVKWTTERGATRIEWDESGRSDCAPLSSTGFGTRLVDTMIRDLQGTIEREFPATGFHCRISFPTSTVQTSSAPVGA